ncbi:MAG: anhydro-N-acetylmuramic acid kinase [Candidatus Velthaea sp.]
MIVAGVLCGTSLDGIDVAIVDVRRAAPRYALTTLAFATVPFAPAMRARLLEAVAPRPLDGPAFGALHADLGDAFGEAVRSVAAGRRLDLVASHGVTIAHDGAAHRTLQLGDAFRIRERAQATVVYDFRAADCAAGGHGAPLVPYLDVMMFGSQTEERVALNLGGIANLTVLPKAGTAAVAFDTGPANLPLDTYVRLRRIGAAPYDRDGAFAQRGAVDAGLLAHLLAEPYFALAPPKSTGRERFGEIFVQQHRAALDGLSPEDALATLTAATVHSIAASILRFAPAAAAVIAGGGGVHNAAIMNGLRRALPATRIETTAAYGMDPDAKEAILFAILGRELIAGRAANLPAVTGARGPRLLGALAPHDFAQLSAVLQGEEQQ